MQEAGYEPAAVLSLLRADAGDDQVHVGDEPGRPAGAGALLRRDEKDPGREAPDRHARDGAHDDGGGGQGVRPDAGRGRVHVQGCFYLGNARSLSGLLKSFVGSPLERAHLEPTRAYEAARKYCGKEDTRCEEFARCSMGSPPESVGGRRGGGVVVQLRKRRAEPTDYFEEAKATEWQRKCLEVVDGEVDRRAVWWFWGQRGNVGKSTLARHLVGFRFRDRAILVGGAAGDIRFGVYSFLTGGKDGKEDEKDLRVVVIDVPRTNAGHVSYQAIEDIKNGAMFSTKYESGMCLFEPPHVIVFANVQPEYDKLSKDRWQVIAINPEENVGNFSVFN